MDETPIIDDDGNVIGFMGSYLPVTDMRGCTVGHMLGTRDINGEMLPALIS